MQAMAILQRISIRSTSVGCEVFTTLPSLPAFMIIPERSRSCHVASSMDIFMVVPMVFTHHEPGADNLTMQVLYRANFVSIFTTRFRPEAVSQKLPLKLILRFRKLQLES